MSKNNPGQGLPDLPDWMEDKLESDLEIDNQEAVPDRHILNHIITELDNAAWTTVRRTASEFDMSKQGMRDRLNSLVDLGILDKRTAGNTDIYWIYSEDTDWPIPPDTEIKPVPDETTIHDIKSTRWFMPLIATGVLAIAGSVLITTAMLMALFSIQPPTISIFGTNLVLPDGLLLIGILFSLLSVVSGLATLSAYATS